MGNQLNRAGIYNDIPDLSDLGNGDLKYSIDFRQVYATILDKWLKVDSELVLKKKFEHLRVFRMLKCWICWCVHCSYRRAISDSLRIRPSSLCHA